MRLETVIALGFALSISTIIPASALPLSAGASGVAPPDAMIEHVQRRVGARSFDAGQAKYYPGQNRNKKKQRQQRPPQ